MDQHRKDLIDNATYYELLQRWRFAPVGDPFFQDEETAEYYMKVMDKMKAADPAGAVADSKAIGW